jgi:hypothetical protein
VSAIALLRSAFGRPAPADILVRRSEAVGALARDLRDVEGWQRDGDEARHRFAARALYVRWLIERGVLRDQL